MSLLVSEVVPHGLMRLVETSFFTHRLYHHLLCMCPMQADDGLGGRVALLRDGVLYYDTNEVEQCSADRLQDVVYGELEGFLTHFPDLCGGDMVFIERVRALVLRARDEVAWRNGIPDTVWETIVTRALQRPEETLASQLRRFATQVRRASGQRTRMRPNRRFGFDAAGRVRANGTRILVAVQVLGGIDPSAFDVLYGQLRHALSHVTQILDVVHFVYGGLTVTDPRPLTNPDVMEYLEDKGYRRVYNPLLRVVQRQHYSGLIIVTSKISPVVLNQLGNTRAAWLHLRENDGQWTCTDLKSQRHDDAFDIERFLSQWEPITLDE